MAVPKGMWSNIKCGRYPKVQCSCYQGAFLPKPLPHGVIQTASIRLLSVLLCPLSIYTNGILTFYRVQQKVKNPDTFSPNVISLPHHRYKKMVDALRLPYRGIETTSAVGPVFWSAFDQDEETPHLRKFCYPCYPIHRI